MIAQHRSFVLPTDPYCHTLGVSPDQKVVVQWDHNSSKATWIDRTSGEVLAFSWAPEPSPEMTSRVFYWLSQGHIQRVDRPESKPGEGPKALALRSFAIEAPGQIATTPTATETFQAAIAAPCPSTQQPLLLVASEGELLGLDPSSLEPCFRLSLGDAVVEAIGVEGERAALLCEEHILLVDLVTQTINATWARASAPPPPTLCAPCNATDIAISEAGDWVALTCYNRSLQLYHKGDCVVERPIPPDEYGGKLAFLQDDQLLLCGSQLFEMASLQYKVRLRHKYHDSIYSSDRPAESVQLLKAEGRLLFASDTLLHELDIFGFLAEYELQGPQREIESMACSPQGEWLAVGMAEGTLQVFSLDTNAPLWQIELGRSSLQALCFLNDGRLLVPLSNEVALLHPQTGALEQLWVLPELNSCSHILQREKGDKLLFRCYDKLLLVDATTGSLERTFGPFYEDEDGADEYGYRPTHHIEDVDLSPDGQLLSVSLGYGDKSVLIDTKTGETLHTFPEAQLLRFGADGRSLLLREEGISRWLTWPSLERIDDRPSITLEGTPWMLSSDQMLLHHHSGLALCELGEEEPLWHTRYHDGARVIALDEARGVFYTSSDSHWIGRRSLEEGELLAILPAGRGHAISTLTFDPTGRYLLAGDRGGRIQAWDCSSYTLASLLDTSSVQGEDAVMEIESLGTPNHLLFSPDGEALRVFADSLLTWTHWHQGFFSNPPDEIDTEADLYFDQMTPDGRLVLHGHSYEGRVEIAERQAPQEPQIIETGFESFDKALLSDDGLLLALAGSTNNGTSMELWDVEEKRLRWTLQVDDEVSAFSFHPKRPALLLLFSDDPYSSTPKEGGAALWDVETGEITAFVTSSALPRVCGANELRPLSNTGLWVAQKHNETLLFQWPDDGTPALISVLVGHKEWSGDQWAYSQESGLLATADQGGEIRLWSAETGCCMAMFQCTTDGRWRAKQQGVKP